MDIGRKGAIMGRKSQFACAKSEPDEGREKRQGLKNSRGLRKTTRGGVVLEWALEKNKQRIYYPAPLLYPFPLRKGVRENKKCGIVKGVTQRKKN